MRIVASLCLALMGLVLINASSMMLKRSADHEGVQRQKRSGCPAGQAPDANNQCAKCAVGYYAADGSTTCGLCDASKNMVPTGDQSACICVPGYAVSTYFSDDGPRCSCVRCPASSVPNANSSACDQCPAGKVPTPDQTTCVQCPVGEIPNANQAACDTCALGYTSTVGQSTCNPIPGYNGANPGKCPAGTFQPTTGSSCVKCAAGTYSTSVGATSATTCVQCPAGTYSSTTGAGDANACSRCDPGYHSEAGSSKCTACIPGTFQATSGQHTCVTCAAGMYSIGTGNTACTSCSADSYSEVHATSCKPCDAAKNLVPNADHSACICASGYTVKTVIDYNGPRCSCVQSANVCPAGRVPNANQTACVQCSAGTYSTAGATTCTTCAAGTTSAAGAGSCNVVAAVSSIKCVRKATITESSPCMNTRIKTGCPLHYDSDKTTYVGLVIDSSGNYCTSPTYSTCACLPGYTYDAASYKCVRKATITNTSICYETSQALSGCPPHYDNDKTTYVGLVIDKDISCNNNPTCGCHPGFTYGAATNKCVRKATITNTSPCVDNRGLSGCPLHYDSDKTTYVGTFLDHNFGCDEFSKCSCHPGYTYEAASNKCVRKAAVTITSTCSYSSVQAISGCPLHYATDKTTYVGAVFDLTFGCTGKCRCQVGFTYDAVSNKCVLDARNDATCSSTGSRCPFHYDRDNTTFTGHIYDESIPICYHICYCENGYDMITA